MFSDWKDTFKCKRISGARARGVDLFVVLDSLLAGAVRVWGRGWWLIWLGLGIGLCDPE